METARAGVLATPVGTHFDSTRTYAQDPAEEGPRADASR